MQFGLQFSCSVGRLHVANDQSEIEYYGIPIAIMFISPDTLTHTCSVANKVQQCLEAAFKGGFENNVQHSND